MWDLCSLCGGQFRRRRRRSRRRRRLPNETGSQLLACFDLFFRKHLSCAQDKLTFYSIRFVGLYRQDKESAVARQCWLYRYCFNYASMYYVINMIHSIW